MKIDKSKLPSAIANGLWIGFALGGIAYGLFVLTRVIQRQLGTSSTSMALSLAALAAMVTFTSGRLLLSKIAEVRTAPSLIGRAPGGGLRRIAQLCFSKKVYDRVFEQALCDLQLEYFEALAKGDRLKARFVLVRGYGAFWMAFVAQLPVSLAKIVVELWLVSK